MSVVECIAFLHDCYTHKYVILVVWDVNLARIMRLFRAMREKNKKLKFSGVSGDLNMKIMGNFFSFTYFQPVALILNFDFFICFELCLCLFLY